MCMIVARHELTIFTIQLHTVGGQPMTKTRAFTSHSDLFAWLQSLIHQYSKRMQSTTISDRTSIRLNRCRCRWFCATIIVKKPTLHFDFDFWFSSFFIHNKFYLFTMNTELLQFRRIKMIWKQTKKKFGSVLFYFIDKKLIKYQHINLCQSFRIGKFFSWKKKWKQKIISKINAWEKSTWKSVDILLCDSHWLTAENLYFLDI